MPIIMSDKEFNDVVNFIKNNYENIKENSSGKVADYIKFLSGAHLKILGFRFILLIIKNLALDNLINM